MGAFLMIFSKIHTIVSLHSTQILLVKLLTNLQDE